MDRIPIYLRSQAKAVYIGIQIVSTGMAINLLSSASPGQGLREALAAAGCFLVAGVVTVGLVQRIETIDSSATSFMVTQSVLKAVGKEANVWSFKEAYRHEAGDASWVAWSGVALGALAFASGTLLWLNSLDLCRLQVPL